MSQVDGAHGMSQVISAQEAIRQLRDGKVVAIPTETVYGLAASVGHPDALASIYTLKGRPKDNPMILHGASVEQLLPFVEGWSQVHQACADAFWPGPLTLILRASKQVPTIVTAGLDTVAIRVPNHPLALEILEHTGPLAAPSANLSGSPSATKASHVVDDFGDAVAVVDGDQAAIGLESTVVWAAGNEEGNEMDNGASSEWRVLRPGVIGADEIGDVAGVVVAGVSCQKDNEAPISPGTKYRHYTPKAEVRWMDVETAKALEELGQGTTLQLITVTKETNLWAKALQKRRSTLNHLHANSFQELAVNLYKWFRWADHHQNECIYIESFTPSSPLEESIHNRVNKAISTP